MSVPFFSQRVSFERQRARIFELLDQAVDAGGFVDGPLVATLERALERRTGARHVVSVASGTDALILALEAAGVGRGDEVIVPVYTFIASATAVVHAGARPVFVDVDPDSYGIDVDAADAAAAVSGARAIMPVHLFQHMADMDGVAALAERRGITIVEDSAEGIEMRYRGRHAGRLGRAGVLSFFPTKTLGALGDAGAVMTDDDEIEARVRSRRSHGQRLGAQPYVWEQPGRNSRMDDVQAAVLLARLETLDAEVKRRRELAALYDEGLLAAREWVTAPRPNPPHVEAAVYVYLIEAQARDALIAHLAERGIGTETYYPRPLHMQPCFTELGYREGDFPTAERAARRAVALPLYPDLTDGQVEQVCDAITEFYEHDRARSVLPA